MKKRTEIYKRLQSCNLDPRGTLTANERKGSARLGLGRSASPCEGMGSSFQSSLIAPRLGYLNNFIRFKQADVSKP